MTTWPLAGASACTRHRKSWASSVLFGALKAATRTPEGFMPSNARRMAPPLPEVSMPWITTSSLWRPSA